jgi:hypothetical protein
MTGTFDQSLENLRTYCELLRVTNPVLEAGAADLGRLGHSLEDTTSQLSEGLDHLATDVDSLQQEAGTSGAATVKACEELGHAAEEVNASGLAELEKDAAEAQQHWIAALHETTASLDGAFQELTAQGWQPLEQALAAEQADFEKWTHDANEILDGLVQAIHTVETGVAHQGTLLDEAARELEAIPPFPQTYWGGVGTHAVTLADETVPHFVQQAGQHAAAMTAAHEELVGSAVESSARVRAQLDLAAEMAVTAIDATTTDMTQVVEAVEEALKNAQTEFERAAIQAEDAEKEAEDLAELAVHVTVASDQLTQVQALLEALGG